MICSIVRYLSICFTNNWWWLIKNKKQLHNLLSLRLKNELLQGHMLVCYQLGDFASFNACITHLGLPKLRNCAMYRIIQTNLPSSVIFTTIRQKSKKTLYISASACNSFALCEYWILSPYEHVKHFFMWCQFPSLLALLFTCHTSETEFFMSNLWMYVAGLYLCQGRMLCQQPCIWHG